MKKTMALLVVIILLFSFIAYSGCATQSDSPKNDTAKVESLDTALAVEDNVIPLAPISVDEIVPVSIENEDETKYFYSISVGDIIKFGGYEWRVLDLRGVRALVVSERILFKMPYQKAEDGHEFVTMPITWEQCELRQYLNEEFYNVTFSEEEKKLIAETTLHTNNNPWSDTTGGNDTKDKVFLLSLDEVLQYYGDSEVVQDWHGYETFVNDQFNEKRIALTLDNQSSWWWLRSPGAYWYQCDTNHIVASSIMMNGGLGIQGEYVSNQYGGVRPAMWLNLRLGL